MGFFQKTIDPSEALPIWSDAYGLIIHWHFFVVLQQRLVAFQGLDDQVDGLLQQKLSEVAKHHFKVWDVHLYIVASHGSWLKQLNV